MEAVGRTSVDALLVGYENHENIGLRSIMAYLATRGYSSVLVPFMPGRHDQVLAAIQHFRPRLVGFSLIFQFAIDEFGQLMRFLRTCGVNAHFVAGGHFPSLRPEETLQLLPELDSVVRSEGELTLAELLDYLEEPHLWETICGVAFRRGTGVVITPPRPLVANLDLLPIIYRDIPRTVSGGIRTASMLASRGCLFDCSFCSIRQFYGNAPGGLRRVRSPEAVVEEMRTLYVKDDVRLFLFQDDDFAARTPRQRQWLEGFIRAMTKAGLSGQVRWKISCRVDDLDGAILDELIEHGLLAVYLGVESGSETGLSTMNKHVTLGQNQAAIELLKSRDVALSIGFMLFDPSSTERTIRENLRFLRLVGADGYFPVSFCKLLPYAGTPIEAQLRAQGRLRGSAIRPDYDLPDPRLEPYLFLVQRIFSERNFSPHGLVERLQQASFDYRIACSFGLPGYSKGYGAALRELISRSNKLALDSLEDLLNAVTECEIAALLDEETRLISLTEREWRGELELDLELVALNNRSGPMWI